MRSWRRPGKSSKRPLAASNVEQLEALSVTMSDCRNCSLHERRIKDQNRKVVLGHGNPNAKLFFVGEAPGKQEETIGEPFVGPAGGYLEGFLKVLANKEEGSSFSREDVFITNSVCCRPCDEFRADPGSSVMTTADKAPNKDALAACSDRLYEEIYIVDPVLIVALGRTALRALSGVSHKLSDWVGSVLTVQIPGRSAVDRQRRLVPYACLVTYHPSHLLRNRALEDMSTGSLGMQFLQHLDLAVSIVNEHSQREEAISGENA